MMMAEGLKQVAEMQDLMAIDVKTRQNKQSTGKFQLSVGRPSSKTEHLFEGRKQYASKNSSSQIPTANNSLKF